MLSRYNALMLTRLLSVFLVLATSLALVPARAQVPNLAGLAVSETPPPLPFTRGETLVYEVTFSRLVFSGTIGSLTLTVAPSRANMPDSVEFKAEGVSKGFFTWLFKIKVNDKYISSVSRDDLGLESSTQNIEEGTVRREQKLIVDRAAGKATYTVKDLSRKPLADKLVRAESPAWVQDLLSAVYYIRARRLNEGDKITIPIIEAARLYHIDVVAGKHEEVAAGKSKYRALRLDVMAFGGRYIKRGGQMLVWVTDDARRIPVKEIGRAHV